MSSVDFLVLSREDLIKIMCEYCGCDLKSQRADEIKKYIDKLFKEEMKSYEDLVKKSMVRL